MNVLMIEYNCSFAYADIDYIRFVRTFSFSHHRHIFCLHNPTICYIRPQKSVLSNVKYEKQKDGVWSTEQWTCYTIHDCWTHENVQTLNGITVNSTLKCDDHVSAMNTPVKLQSVSRLNKNALVVISCCKVSFWPTLQNKNVKSSC